MATQVKVEARRASDGVFDLVVLKCPYCGRVHLHGGGNGEQPILGHRLSHCWERLPRDYELVRGEPNGN